jgi:hypothetical protein
MHVLRKLVLIEIKMISAVACLRGSGQGNTPCLVRQKEAGISDNKWLFSERVISLKQFVQAKIDGVPMLTDVVTIDACNMDRHRRRHF